MQGFMTMFLPLTYLIVSTLAKQQPSSVLGARDLLLVRNSVTVLIATSLMLMPLLLHEAANTCHLGSPGLLFSGRIDSDHIAANSSDKPVFSLDLLTRSSLIDSRRPYKTIM